MSVVVTRSLSCDRCANWTDGGDPLAPLTLIRRRAVREGWRRVNGEDLCPDEEDE